MKILDLLEKNTMVMDLKGDTKEAVIDELIEALDKSGKLSDKNAYREAILKRESQSSTGLEEGIAIPHAKVVAVKTPALAFGLHRSGVDYDALDGEPSQLFFMIAASEGASDSHIETLTKLTTSLLDDDFREALLKAETKEEVVSIISKKDSEEESSEENNVMDSEEKGFLLAVTACPTGIAHTYMAADSLKKKAQEMGINIKVETNGSTGIKNPLTKEEIDNAAAIIIAADKKVEMDRFDGKFLLEVPVKEGIRDPEGLIKKALNKEAPVYKASGEKSNSSSSGERKGFYKHLMNGVSNMLPFVVAGGILIAISFMFGIKAFDPNDPTFSPIAKFLMDVGGGGAFALMIPILAGFIGMSIADRPGFMPAMVGGFMAANQGGGFLGGLIAGFIGGYIVLAVKKATSGMPQTLEGLKPVLIFPILGLLFTGLAMKIILIPVVSINAAMANFLTNMGTGNLVLMGIVLGGMMAVDMGGPVNKAAFTFGIAAIESGNLAPHAAVMAGGMVPPIAIALATTFFKNKFSLQERESGLTNYIMGASFITEGAIPFAAADPGRVIPACILGSAVAGGLAMMFGCELPAPHGGLFVIPLVKNAAMYLVAIIAGSSLAALLIGTLKKPLEK